ncbi:electron transport complex subunit RsxG [Motiliproteus sediminis]|uniref:electron transport complex subunit RsxG n=1 Tax=Motiliproteus sediminis TaxID=1468178 RepID=UPI001AEF8505|nr:electron transport complex subunit RsxG [Motiliproteus sediminis]
MSLVSAIRTNSLGLSLFALITAGAIAVTQVMTRDSIAANREEAAARALYEIIPAERIDNDLLHDTVTLPRAQQVGSEGPLAIHLARKDDQVIGVIVPVIAADGYTGSIELIVGIEADGTLAGVRILRHQETPGLGDKVDLKKSPWVLGFNGERLQSDDDPGFAVKKDGGRFDQFTGATITPRAVVGGVKRALQLFRDNRAHLLEGSPWEVHRNG